MEPVVDSNEAMHCEYISTILHTALSLLKGLIITPQMKITSEINTGRVDYAIKKILDDLLEEIICINRIKQLWVSAKTQCRSACDMNINISKKKRKVDEAFNSDNEYIYGIVSTDTDWHFILYSTEGIYSTSRIEYQISLIEDALKDDTELCKNVKRVLEVIVSLLKDRALGSEKPATKKCCVEEIIKKK
ncbi:14314_t:CDS:2 [Funneliformis caledonium]|uniref:14314_t:CDS:1 n=1 Tax=Funneliformis caledonium TaxID=1117310 RepID=A0A9N9GCB3_9GLOM|nr:14314_t:CDS:2 [Funneliformis caledonium]